MSEFEESMFGVIFFVILALILFLVWFYLAYLKEKHQYSLFSRMNFGLSAVILIGMSLFFNFFDEKNSLMHQETLWPHLAIFFMFFGNIMIFINNFKKTTWYHAILLHPPSTIIPLWILLPKKSENSR